MGSYMSKEFKIPEKYMSLSFETFGLYKNDFIKYHIPVFRLNAEERFTVFPTKYIEYLLGSGELRERNISKLRLYVQKDFKNVLEKEENNHKVISEKQIKISAMQMSRSNILSKVRDLSSISLEEQDKRVAECSASINKELRIHGATTQDATWAYLNSAVDVVSILIYRLQGGNIEQSTMDKVNYKDLIIPREINIFMRTVSQYFLKKNPTPNMFESLYYYLDNTIISRILRVFTIYYDFLNYYNKIFSESLASKIRKSFMKDYSNYYKKLLFPYNRVDKFIKLEEVVDRSMRVLSQKELSDCSIGGLLETIMFYNHKKRSSSDIKKLMSKYNYSENTILTVALSHDFYEYKNGMFYDKYLQRAEMSSNDKIQFAFTYDIPTLEATNALAYFPAKALEIVSLYDRLLYPDIIPEDEYMILTPEQVIYVIKDEYLEETVKVDPIIFDIFVDYINGQLF